MNKKGIIGIIIAAVLLIGGGALAYTFLTNSPKNAYMLAEKDEMESWSKLFEERYKDELDWYEKGQKEKSESTMKANVTVNEELAQELGMDPSILSMVESVVLDFKSKNDLKNNVSNNELSVKLADSELAKLFFGLNKHDVIVDTSLTSGVQISDKKLTEYVSAQPEMQDFKMDFTELFSPEGTTMPQEDVDYLTAHYGKIFFDQLEDKSFTSKKGDVEVYGNKVKAENLVMTLNKEQIRSSIDAILAEALKDEKTKEIIDNYSKRSSFGLSDGTDTKELFDGLEQARKDLKEADLPEKLVSSIWVKDKVIVNRELTISDADTTFTVAGVREVKKNNANFKYTMGDGTDEVVITGELTYDGKKVNDMIDITFDDTVISYQANEDRKDGGNIFERSISIEPGTTLEDEVGSPFEKMGIVWQGDVKYEKDKMGGTHTFLFRADDSDAFSLHVDADTKIVKRVDPMKASEDVVNLNDMTNEEIDSYFENDFAEEIMNLVGGFGAGF